MHTDSPQVFKFLSSCCSNARVVSPTRPVLAPAPRPPASLYPSPDIGGLHHFHPFHYGCDHPLFLIPVPYAINSIAPWVDSELNPNAVTDCMSYSSLDYPTACTCRYQRYQADWATERISIEESAEEKQHGEKDQLLTKKALKQLRETPELLDKFLQGVGGRLPRKTISFPGLKFFNLCLTQQLPIGYWISNTLVTSLPRLRT